MSLTDREKTPTVIIAYRKPGNHLEDSFHDLKKWFKNIVGVGPENSQTSRIMDGTLIIIVIVFTQESKRNQINFVTFQHGNLYMN